VEQNRCRKLCWTKRKIDGKTSNERTARKNTVLWSGTVVRERCHIGNDCIIHPNAAQMDLNFAALGLVKITNRKCNNKIMSKWCQLMCGNLAKFSSTVLGDLQNDNLVQIGQQQ
jgi:UDP-3-O-[3-hydroxymyristoyl] glucosamine N-acyltransferase